MQISLTLRDLEPGDLADLAWSGGPEHLSALARTWQDTLTGGAVLLVAALPNGRLVATGAADLRRYRGAGFLWMLSVHETLQGLGVGSWLVSALEARLAKQGLREAWLHVEQDNPGAARLYRRLGYTDAGSVLERWPVAGGRTYVTVSAALRHELDHPEPAGVAH